MRFDSTLNLNRKGLMASSLGGLILLFTIFSLPTLLAASLEPDQAEKGIRYYLKHDAMAEHLEQLKVAGLNSPNRKIAERWENDLKYIEQMEFISLEIRHFLFAPPTSSTRIFMVKAVLRDRLQVPQPPGLRIPVQGKNVPVTKHRALIARARFVRRGVDLAVTARDQFDADTRLVENRVSLALCARSPWQGHAE